MQIVYIVLPGKQERRMAVAYDPECVVIHTTGASLIPFAAAVNKGALSGSVDWKTAMARTAVGRLTKRPGFMQLPAAISPTNSLEMRQLFTAYYSRGLAASKDGGECEFIVRGERLAEVREAERRARAACRAATRAGKLARIARAAAEAATPSKRAMRAAAAAEFAAAAEKVRSAGQFTVLRALAPHTA